MKVLFVRPPRYRWPFHSKNSSFWQPLGFASMAAVLRENINVDVKIIDCPIEEIGWKSVKANLLRENPDVLCIGEETVSSHEAIKLINLAKLLIPEIKIICGGVHFTHMVEDSLLNHPIDFIVRFEGEYTLLELIKELMNPNPNFKKIKGIAYLENKKIIKTPLRELIPDLNKLPMPAYDLLQMELYGKNSWNHKNLVAIEHGRGCTSKCNFCVLWKQFGKVSNNKPTPFYRTKSAEKTFQEVLHLYEKYKRKTFCWVDPTWNLDSKWNLEFSKKIIEAGIDINQSAWMRADCIVRDEQNDTFKYQVKADLKQAMIGIERTNNNELRYLDKHIYSFDAIKKSFEIIREYPSVLSIATYIYGIPDETNESLRRFYDYLDKIPFDVGVPIPLTPHPGSKYFEEYKELIEVKKFKYYNFLNPISRSNYLSRNQLLFYMLLNELRIRTKKEQFAKKNYERRNNATASLAKTKAALTYQFLRYILMDVVSNKIMNFNIKPEWYDG